jgi:hypothetical protein
MTKSSGKSDKKVSFTGLRDVLLALMEVRPGCRFEIDSAPPECLGFDCEHCKI